MKLLWRLVRLLKLPVASRGRLHVYRGVDLFDGFSNSGDVCPVVPGGKVSYEMVLQPALPDTGAPIHAHREAYLSTASKLLAFISKVVSSRSVGFQSRR